MVVAVDDVEQVSSSGIVVVVVDETELDSSNGYNGCRSRRCGTR